MKVFAKILINSIAIFVAAYILPGIEIDNFLTAFIVAIVLGAINLLIKPILVLLTLPLTILTLGLFLIVINGVLILLTDALVAGFEVQNFLWALIFSLTVSLISTFFHLLEKQTS